MKKKLFLMCIIGLMSVASAYAKCDGGTEITIPSGTFCMGKNAMNWWTAAAWCQANGRHLATMYEVCPSWNGQSGFQGCPGLSGSSDKYYAWTATAYNSGGAFSVRLSDGHVAADYSRNSDRTTHVYAFYPLCR